MPEITAKLVKELRDKTSAGMMDCKKALVENKGDMEKSVEWLRQKGIASAEKKSGRVAAEGAIGSCSPIVIVFHSNLPLRYLLVFK